MKRECCFINSRGKGCNKPATYEIWFGSGYEDYIDSCLEHISDLFTDAPVHNIYKIVEEEHDVTC